MAVLVQTQGRGSGSSLDLGADVGVELNRPSSLEAQLGQRTSPAVSLPHKRLRQIRTAPSHERSGRSDRPITDAPFGRTGALTRIDANASALRRESKRLAAVARRAPDGE